MRRGLSAVLLAVLVLAGPARGADPTAVPTQVPTPIAPIPLADVAAKSEELGVYLSQVEERWQSTAAEVQAIATALPGISAQVHDRATATHRLLSGFPTRATSTT
jgi:hypothetical protein